MSMPPHEEVVAMHRAEVCGQRNLDFSKPTVDAPVVSESQAPVFESFSYDRLFCLPGLKLSLDENPDDRLGRQMKSLRTGLKVMNAFRKETPRVSPDLGG